MRVGTFIVAFGLLALVGCESPGPAPGPDVSSVDTRMPLAVDYYDHIVRHPVPKRTSGRVDPIETGVGRETNYGPEPAAAPEPAPAPPSITADEAKPSGHPVAPGKAPADPTKGPPGPVSQAGPTPRRSAVAALAAVRAGEPKGDVAFLALAKPRKKHTKLSKAEAADPDDDAALAGDAGAETADNRGIESNDSGYRLNFEDADVKDVLQAVLGNVLGVSYTIAPNVTGRITIASSAPQGRSELLSTLETVLSMQGLSLTRTGSTFRVAPLTLGGGTLDADGSGTGFGISVVPLRYSSVASMNKLLSGFVVEADGIKIDSSRNTVIVRGPGPRRAEIVRAIKAFDGDWMHTQSVSMFELKRARPDDVIQELTRVFDSEKDGDSAGIIEFKSVKRLRSIMVISKNDTLIRRAGAWIRRLDHEDISETSSIFVYRPRYRDARELTKLVNGLFGNGSGSSGDDSKTGSVAFQTNGQSGQSGGFGSSSGQGGLGSSGGSGAGGSQGSGGLTSASFGGGSSGGFGGGSSSGSPFGSSGGSGSSGSSSAFGSLGGGAGGSGLKGELADPIEAGDGRGNATGMKLKLTADTSNNSIVAYTDGETYRKVEAVLRQLDIPPLQVAVNVIIAEVQLNDELKYGVQFFLNQSQKSVGSIGFSTSSLSPTSIVSSAASSVAAGVSTGVTSPIANAISPGAGTGLNFISGGQSSPNIILSALDSISKVHILSTPSIVVMENKPATLEVGNEVPVTTQSAQSNLTADAPTVNSVTYLDTGIILKIIPRIGQNGNVDMQIDQEISSVVPDASGSTSGSLTPTISKRRIASDISVKSGQNVLLAGLVTDTRSKSNGQVPFIGPQLGNLLGNTDNIVSRTELVMFIRPVIIRSGQDAVEITQDFRRGLTAIDLHGQPAYKP